MPNIAQEGPITIYAPRATSPGPQRPSFWSKFKVAFLFLLTLGLTAGLYLFADEVRGVIAQGGSAVTLDAVLDEDFNLSLAGYLEGSRLKSTATSGAPLVVNSTGLVADL